MLMTTCIATNSEILDNNHLTRLGLDNLRLTAECTPPPERVTKRGSFITLDAYRNNEEKDRMEAWNLTAKTVMHVDSWREFFKDVGYTGDYYWFIP